MIHAFGTKCCFMLSPFSLNYEKVDEKDEYNVDEQNNNYFLSDFCIKIIFFYF